jgi:hypothetical protein
MEMWQENSTSRFLALACSPLSGLFWDVQSPNGRISVVAQARESNVGREFFEKQQGKQLRKKYSRCCSTGNSGSWGKINNMRTSIIIISWCKVLFCRQICKKKKKLSYR